MGEGKYTAVLFVVDWLLLVIVIPNVRHLKKISSLYPFASKLSHKHLLKTFEVGSASGFLIGIYHAIIPRPRDITYTYEIHLLRD